MRGINDGLYDLVKDYLLDKTNLVGIEIGSFAGASAEIFLKSNAFKTLYCIDPWEKNFDPNDMSTSNGLETAERKFDEKFKDNKIIVKVKMKSVDALNMFENDSIDFIYIDGNHQYDFVKQDIENYFSKIKPGGIIAGHDYDVHQRIPHIKGVKIAVDEFFKQPPLNVYSDNSWVYIKDSCY
jgi:predicted O-methyltransferase YrrM